MDQDADKSANNPGVVNLGIRIIQEKCNVMYRKREREFQYPPGIEKIIEDVIGGGTIDRRDLRNALFNGKSLDELPPIVIVVKDPETGLYHVLKTAMASDAGNETTYKVSKNHLFGVGDFVTIGEL